ncbi:MAG TPA: site-specific integrase [Alphaproteobacteria bacterium]|nr:site-specific integrase [Alphaproteobacteria bacterium]
MAKLVHSLDTDAFIEPLKLTVREYLDRWLEHAARNAVSAKTFERYKELVDHHLNPSLGQILLPKLQPLHVQALYSAKRASGRKDGTGGLSPQTIVHIHRVLRAALSQAVKWQMLNRNVADAVDPPKVTRREMRALTEHETGNLLSALSGSKFYIPVLIAVVTGLRRGELLALRWQDVDLDIGQVTIQQSLEQTKAGLAFKQPKTSRGRRTIALPLIAVDALRAHRAGQAAERLRLGPAFHDQGLVFCKADGKAWEPVNFSSDFTALMRRLPITRVRFHDLRHTHASHLLRQGVNPKVVSERLGHSTVAFTLDVYSHVLPGMQDDAARRIDAALRPVIGESPQRNG